MKGVRVCAGLLLQRCNWKSVNCQELQLDLGGMCGAIHRAIDARQNEQ